LLLHLVTSAVPDDARAACLVIHSPSFINHAYSHPFFTPTLSLTLWTGSAACAVLSVAGMLFLTSVGALLLVQPFFVNPELEVAGDAEAAAFSCFCAVSARRHDCIAVLVTHVRAVAFATASIQRAMPCGVNAAALPLLRALPPPPRPLQCLSCSSGVAVGTSDSQRSHMLHT
jgi:hypothetical protein